MASDDSVSIGVRKLLRKWPGSTALYEAMRRFPGVEVYLVGGSLRDLLLGLHRPRDFDFLIDGQQFEAMFDFLADHGRLTSGPFGSPRWHPPLDEQQFCDIVPIKSFYNGLWRCDDIVDALNQFDFTANAVAIDLRSSAFYDPQNGRRDINRRILRAVRFDYPDEPIGPGRLLTRPAVLWIRLLHYAVAKGLSIKPVTMRWLRAHAHYQSNVEYFRQEFFLPHVNAFDALAKQSDD